MKIHTRFLKSKAKLINEMEMLQLKCNQLEYRLNERQKELNILYAISSLLEQSDRSLDYIMQQIVDLLPSGWQYPDETCARIVVGEKEYRTANYKPSPWKLSRDIRIDNSQYGEVEVLYLLEKPDECCGPFFREEVELLNVIAERIAKITARKFLEVEVSVVFEESPVAKCIIGLTDNYIIREVNNKFEEIMGLTSDRLKGVSLSDINIFSKDVFDSSILPELNKTGEIRNFEHVFVNTAGERKVGLLNIHRIKLPSVEEIAIIAINDITELKETLYINQQNQSALEDLYYNLKESQSLAKLSNWEYDVKSGMFRFNENFYKIFHSSVEEIGSYMMTPEEYATRFIPPHAQAVVAQETQKALQTTNRDYSRYLEHEILYADGGSGYIAVRLRITKNSEGETVTIFGVNQDITEKVLKEKELIAAKEEAESIAEKLNRAQLKLFRGERLLKDVQSISKTGGWEYVVDTQKMFWTPELFRIHELEDEPGINHIERSLQCYLPEDRERILKAFNDCLKTGTGYELEVPFVTCLGNHKWIRTRTQAVVENGLVTRVIGSVIDITEQKKYRDQLIQYSGNLESMVEERTEKLSGEIELRKVAEQDLLSIQHEIEEKNKMLSDLNITKDKFFSIIAHDLRNPFNSLIGYSDLLRMNAANIPQEKLVHFAELMNSSAREAYTLLQNLLEWSRIQTGKITPNPVQITPSDLINEVQMLYTPLAQTKEIDLVMNTEAGLPVYADIEMIKTVLRNLVSNAIKFTFPHGVVSITTSRAGRSMVFTVTDNGTGIDAAEIQMLFRIDSKLTKYGTANEKGTGLGLILCKEFVELNHGKIWVESEFGKGSSFKFSLPLFSEVN